MTSDALRRVLLKQEIPLVRINERALAIEEAHLLAFVASRSGYSGKGRPRKVASAEDGNAVALHD